MNDPKSDWESLQRARQIHPANEAAAAKRQSEMWWDATRRKHRQTQDMIDEMGARLAQDRQRRADERGREVPPDLYAQSREAAEIRAAIKQVQEQHKSIEQRLASRPKRIRAPSGKVYEVEESDDGLSFKKT